MHNSALTTLLLVATSCAHTSGTPGEVGEVTASETGRVFGVVKDSQTNTPVSKAVVVLSCERFQGFRTVSVAGAFEFRELPPGTCHLEVFASWGSESVTGDFLLTAGDSFHNDVFVTPRAPLHITPVTIDADASVAW